jgi:lipid A 3-O-deacylase
MKRTLGGVVALALPALVAGAPASAQSFLSELQLGVLAHDVPILGEQKEHGVDINGEVLFVSPVPDTWLDGVTPALRWLLTPRPDVGLDANTAGATSQLYLGLTWTADLFRDVFTPQDSVYLAVGFGPAFNNGHIWGSSGHAALGSNVLFHPSIELGYRFTPRYSVSLYFEHSSNGGLAQRNDALNNLGVRLGLGF